MLHTSLQLSFGCFRRALQFQRKGQKSFPPQLWKQLYLIAISEGPDLRMAARAVDSEHMPSPDMIKCSLPHLSSYIAKTLFGQGLLQIGKYKQGDVWLEGQGGVPCPVVCRNDKYQAVDGYLTPANNQLSALNKTAKKSILPANGERMVVTYILMRPEHIASFQYVLLKKHSFPVPAFAYPA